MPSLSKFVVAAGAFAVAASPALGDVYMHNPRGSNNRNCRNDNNTNRRNGNRLFDSQNNDKGGYSCPRAYPFACYDNQCNNNQNNNAGANALNADGQLVNNGNLDELTNTPRQYYYEGSILPIEWTNQHGCGTNTKLRCRMVVQYACEDTLPLMRDGTPIRNNGGNNRNDEATDTIPDNNNNNVQNDYRYGRHETLNYYQTCDNTARNARLYTADQNLQGDTAIYTRQNPNGNRNGLECAEESEYHPYWNPTPWKDLTVLTDNLEECATIQAESQNVKSKFQCTGINNGDIPIEAAQCTANGGTWTEVAAHNVPAPSCALGPWTRDNHLGNAGAGNVPGQAATFNITMAPDMVGKGNCVVRLRYNMSSSDTTNLTPLAAANAREIPIVGDVNDNNAIADRNNNEEASYKAFQGYQLGTAVNTNQYGRVFQDRSYVFTVKAAPTAAQSAGCGGKAIYNLNVRGKRGNIVQAYPSVEYDFVPSVLEMETDDCVHVQFAGTDYNPNRNPNNGEGGPSNPNNDGEAKSDRTNFVPMEFERTNFPVVDASAPQYNAAKVFNEDVSTFKKLAFLDQDIGGECETIQQLKQRIGGNGNGNREERERYHTNCAKLSGQKVPVVDLGLIQASTTPGSFSAISTRNNNLSNRGQKMNIVVTAPGALESEPGKLPINANNDFGNANPDGASGTPPAAAAAAAAAGGDTTIIAAAVGGGLVAVGAAFVAYRRSSGGSSAAPAGAMAAAPMGGSDIVTARYAHNAKEAGELSFGKGEQITVTRRDASGWWEGQTASGARGVFPSNYVQ